MVIILNTTTILNNLKTTNKIKWVLVNNKTILIISDEWKGIPIIASYADLLIISKETKERYKDCFIGDGKKIKVCYL